MEQGEEVGTFLVIVLLLFCSQSLKNQAETSVDLCFYRRRLQIEEMEARIAMMPLLQAEQDRR